MSLNQSANSGNSTELTPFEEQEPFLRNDKSYYGYISGVGSGKTYIGILRTVLNMEKWNPGEMGAIVAPTTTMIRDIIIPEMEDLGLFDHYDYHGPHSAEPGIHAPNGSRALLLSADNKRQIGRLKGLNLAWGWMDEEAEINPRARQILTQRLRVGTYRNMYVTTTPEGKNHTYDFFVGDVDGEYSTHGEADIYTSDDRLAILKVPSYANPHTPDDYKEQLDKTHSGQRYEQEVLGKFVDFEGLVYPWFGDDNTIDYDDIPETYDETIYGVDWGSNNPSVILAIRVVHGDTTEFYISEELYESRLTINDISEQLGTMQDEHGVGPVYCDPAEPASIQTLERDGFDARKANNSVDDGIRRVDSLRNAIYVADTCQNIKNEFNQYRYKDDSDKILKANDHAMDGLRYSLLSYETDKKQTGAWTVV